MNNAEIKEGIDYFKKCAAGITPNKIVIKAFSFTNYLIAKLRWPVSKANLIANLIIQSGYVTVNGMWMLLTDKGYDLVNGETALTLTPDFNELCIGNTRQDNFYIIWEVIGNDSENNPLYVSGPEFYNTAHPYLSGFPHTYSEYMEYLRNSDKSTSRSSWYKDLFCIITDEDIPNFLDNLSHLLLLRAGQAQKPIEVEPILT